MRILVFSTTATALFAATTAMASGPAPAPVEPPVAQPAPPPAFTWTGPYAGVQIGMLDGNVDWSDSRPEEMMNGESISAEINGGGGYSASPDADGFVGGIYGGYNFHSSGNTVFGVEAEYNWSHADGEDDITYSGGSPTPYTLESEITDTAAIRGRLGYAMDRTLFYGAAGVAWASLNLEVFEPKAGSVADWSDTLNGWTIGAGVEHAFTDRMVGRIDYRYSDFGEEEDFDGSGTDVEMDTHEIRAGVAFRF
ncbi:hypothetical protein C2I36_01405 [Rhodobacteraceae bacterium WD3A24]|nr:hypothetical protein C2I36_01405 [Rhodobacteraceae bacterium WD3A24]